MRRVFREQLRWLFSLSLILALATTGFAWPPGGNGNGNGGGGNGGGEDPPTDPPPVTYMIYRAQDFRVQELNNQNDMLGQVPQGYEVSYNGEHYSVDNYFTDPDVGLRLVFGLSDRASNGSVYLCGSCDTPDGVRGWVMRLTPDSNGDLQRTEFNTVEPVNDDEVTALRSVNSWGEAAGYSRTDESNLTAIYYSAETGTTPIGGPTWYGQHMTESGVWVGVLEDVDGSFAQYMWTLEDGLQFLVADVQGVYVNNFGHMVGFVTTYSTKGNNTIRTDTNVFFDGTLTYLDERHSSGPTMRGINDFDDYLVQRREDPKGQASIYYFGTLYFADINQEFAVDDMLDPANSQADLDAWFSATSKSFAGLNNAGVIAAYQDTGGSATTFVLVPVIP